MSKYNRCHIGIIFTHKASHPGFIMCRNFKRSTQNDKSMFKFIWRIRRVNHRLYQITLDPSSFAYYSFPKSDRQWQNDNIEELIIKANEVVRINTVYDLYNKIWEYSDIIYDIDGAVIEEIRKEGEDKVLPSKICLFLITAVSLIALALYCFFH